jgi:molybdopterin-containing oxidoreductase family iron-sulfur binding subunit
MNQRKDLAPEMARRLESAGGKKYWRTLEELADSEFFQELMRQEFPNQSWVWPSPPTRRQFLALMGASLALAGIGGCSIRPAPSITLVPYVRQPEEIVPGRPLFYATSMTLGGSAVGLLVESHLGRPTKIEGNPDHPASLGATDLFNQASVLTLYDPDRSQKVTRLGQTVTWNDALSALRAALERQRSNDGAGLRLLTETVVSPTLGAQIKELLDKFKNAKWHQYEPLARDSAHRAAVSAFGEEKDKPAPHTYYRFYDREAKRRTADVIVSLDADFLSCGPGNLRYAAEFTDGRRVRANNKAEAARATMNRLYVVETALTPTGAKADHRLAVPASQIEGVARALAAELKVEGVPPAPEGLSAEVRNWVKHVAADLRYRDPTEAGKPRNQPRDEGSTVVVAGDRQPAVVHLLVQAINRELKNVGKTVFYTDPIQSKPVDQLASLQELVNDLDSGKVEMLLILGGNPAFTAPADLDFTGKLETFSRNEGNPDAKNRPWLSAHLSLYQDETSRRCQWHLPETHFLEAWSDALAFDGTASIVQPLIEPLYQGRSAHEVLSALSDRLSTPGYEIVRSYWRKHGKDSKGQSVTDENFDEFWQTALHDGTISAPATPWTSKEVEDRWQKDWQKHLRGAGTAAPLPEGRYELVFQQDPTIYDGRFANNGWLQELPKPITRLTWDNAALMSPATADELHIPSGSYTSGGEHGGYHQPVIELRVRDGQTLRTVKAPVWIMPGHADRSITVYLGYGRENAGRVGGSPDHPVGFNAYALRTTGGLWFTAIDRPERLRERYALACTQAHQLMENRNLVRSTTLATFQQTPDFAQQVETEPGEGKKPDRRHPLPTLHPGDPEEGPTLYPKQEASEHRWAMAIDLTACVGCNACVVACQAENNIPVVGKDQVLAGREMHWLRVDRYNTGPADKPEEFYFQPVPCMHCENAPCEYVCPVEATVHSADGLNDMVYQRCVGTRYCSNNCPYKVRRFNFFHYADYTTESVRLQYNPDVTVRSRGVMEKCSYCVQRIRQADIGAQRDGRTIRDKEILTACQAACPAQAIVFGDLNQDGREDREHSEVNKMKGTVLNYGLFDDLNTRPRTTYLAALRNPNPTWSEP